jgi:hypothetical protein
MIVNNYYCCHPPHPPAGRVVFRLGQARDLDGPPPAGQHKSRRFSERPDVIMDIQTLQFSDVSVTITDRRGNPAPVDGVPVWATDNSDLVTLEPAADGLSCKVTTGTMAGTATVQMTADADLGSGSVPLIGTLELVITTPPATVVTLTPSAPADVP